MNKKRIVATAVVLAVLCLLIYLQVHTWKKFDWATFWNNTSHVNWWFVLLASRSPIRLRTARNALAHFPETAVHDHYAHGCSVRSSSASQDWRCWGDREK